MTSDPPPIRWSPSPRSLTCELGREGTRTLFSIINRRYEFALHPWIPGRDGIALRSEAFEVHDQPPEAARERARARAQEMWHEFLLDLAMPSGHRSPDRRNRTRRTRSFGFAQASDEVGTT